MLSTSFIPCLALASVGAALHLGVNDEASIKRAASKIAQGLYVYHDPKSTAGSFDQPQPWFWWLSGNGWNGLLDYTIYTNDTRYKADLLTTVAANQGPNYDFTVPAQVYWEANDDQMFWVYIALTALEHDFDPLPCQKLNPGDSACANSWLALSTNAFELFAARWAGDSATCGGGLKWQWRTDVSGHTYKNSVTNGGFFQIAARLARFTGNGTYTEWADKIWDWSTAVGMVSPDYHVYDGTSDGNNENCTGMNHDEWSYNAATYLHGAANMYALAGADQAVWEARVHGLLDAANQTFFGPVANATGVMYEPKCELTSSCGTDQTSFKSSLSRWMARTAVLVPGTREPIMELLKTSAAGAALACSGLGNSTCGMKWYIDAFDGHSDFGAVLSALEVVQGLLA